MFGYCMIGVRLSLIAALMLGAPIAGAQSSRGLQLPDRLMSAFTLLYVAAQMRAGSALADEWADGSPGSVSLLNSYHAEDCDELVAKLTRNADPSVVQWQLAGPSPGSTSKAEATVSDKFAQVRGFKVEISGSSGKEVDTAWESVSGGDMVIEHTETSIGADKFSALDLRGSLKSLGGPLAGISAPQIPQKKVNLYLIGDGGRQLGTFDYQALDALFVKDQLLILWTDGNVLRISQFTVTLLTKDGSVAAPAPKLLLAFPGEASAGEQIALVGSNFDRGTIPYINSVPSLAMFNLSSRNIPLLGSISVGFTIVPPAAKPGSGDVMVEYNGQQSNRFPFTVN
jgi:hypothetical protein